MNAQVWVLYAYPAMRMDGKPLVREFRRLEDAVKAILATPEHMRLHLDRKDTHGRHDSR